MLIPFEFLWKGFEKNKKNSEEIMDGAGFLRT